MNSSKELFSAVAVIALLFLCGASVVSGTKRFHVKCTDNLKHLRQAAQQYENDHKGIIVPVLMPVKNRAVFWSERILPYLGSRMEIFYCPQDERRGAKMLDVPDLLPIGYSVNAVSYGMNYYIGDVGRSRKSQKTSDYHVSRITDPSRLIYFGDAKSLRLRPTRMCWDRDYAPRHKNGSYFVFADGHTEWLNHKTLGLLDQLNGDPRWERDPGRWLLGKKNKR